MNYYLNEEKQKKLDEFIYKTGISCENAIYYLEFNNWNVEKTYNLFLNEKQMENNKGGLLSRMFNYLFVDGICRKNDDYILTSNQNNKNITNNIEIQNSKINNNNFGSNKNIFENNSDNFNNGNENDNNLIDKNNILINKDLNNSDNSNNFMDNDSKNELSINTNSKNKKLYNNNTNNNNNITNKLNQNNNNEEKLINIIFKFHKKNKIERQFSYTDTIQSLYDFIYDKIGKNKKKKFLLVRPYPYLIYNDKNKTLIDAGLVQNPILHIREDD